MARGVVTGLAREVEEEALRRGRILDKSGGGSGVTGSLSSETSVT